VAAGEGLTLENAAQVVAGCNGDREPWYEMGKAKRCRLRKRAERLLRVGVEYGNIRQVEIHDADGVPIVVWEATGLMEMQV